MLLELARSHNVGSGNLDAALREITETAARALGVDRVSIWLYSDARDSINCIDLYIQAGGAHTNGIALAAADYPHYFAALERDRAISAHNAHTDARTHEFSAGYLTPLGINSMLDAPIRVRGQMIGVVCHEHVGPVRHWSSEEESFAGSIADFTALAIQANELARANEQLHSEIAARKRTEAELRSAREAAEEASRAKSAFLANLSHELRTPLNAIIGFSEILRDSVDPSLVRKIAAIESSGLTLLTMINELLELAALEAGLTTIETDRFDLRDLLERLVSGARLAAEEKGNRFEVSSTFPAIVIHGDAEKLWRILWNLCENAIKFTTQGTITVRAETFTGDGGECARFLIRDEGIGIPSDQLETIFEPFAQGDSSLRRSYGGAGLGLAISRRLCELMGGRIDVESAPGAGSTFVVTLPLRQG